MGGVLLSMGGASLSMGEGNQLWAVGGHSVGG